MQGRIYSADTPKATSQPRSSAVSQQFVGTLTVSATARNPFDETNDLLRQAGEPSLGALAASSKRTAKVAPAGLTHAPEESASCCIIG
ncbi:MAG: hypothetical protein K0Q57_580 [Gammaproteobacteria bacterium]|jgi:hypothetical protein|nr:hypothetical protein [Gammaproteobacteria bacterium]